MKRIVTAVVLALLPVAAQAQQETLVAGPIRSGGFGAPVLKFTEINQQFGFFVGGRGGWIINESLVLGGGGYGLTNQAHLAFDALEMGYGGLDLEYVNRPNELVHVSLAVLLGGGGATYYPSSSLAGFSSGFFVVEPAANIMLNVTPIFRIGVGASYRAVESLSLPELTNRDLSGFSGNIQFKFGMFTGR